MTHYDEDADGVTVHFDRGEPSVRARVVVGADGYFSKVRSHCLDDGPPTFNVSAILPTCLHVHTSAAVLQSD